ncbi:uncharacterized protein LOC125587131 [Brassica napus]|uniref:uncharacterized protein LOC125587131 n=1 Tax=Brassica napus TaxID=3708 RepID=UPI002079D745|nr:uncharacterized protein LOC125587131 [Brassica napus]
MTAPPSLVERIRRSEDKTLRRLAPLSIGATGRPRVLIPDSVFQKRAELHKDFIICYFNGKAPPFNQIQSVFNHMWGKGKRLEIHNNPLNHSAIVRIQSEYLRQKIFDKSIWYVGDSMFHIAQWSSAHSKATPLLKAIKIWAHLTGVPLDLRHNEGLSFVSGLVGGGGRYKTAFDVVDFEREDGEVVEVSVHYPRVPPKCTHCQELSHITRNCLSYTPPPNEPEGAKKKAHVNKTAPAQNKKYRPVTQGTKVNHSKSAPTNAVISDPAPSTRIAAPHPSPTLPSPTPIKHTSHLTKLASKPSSSNLFQTTSPIPRPSLKRSQSHIKQPSLTPILSNLCPNWRFTSNHLSDPDGRIILIWRDSLKVQVLSQSRQCITCILSFPNNHPVYYSAIYASNLSSERVDLWAELIQLQSTYNLYSSCWILGRDLNQIIHPTEHPDPNVNVPGFLMYQLRDCLTQLGLFDLRYVGAAHTWTNSQPSGPYSKKMDMLMVNSSFVSTFPHALPTFLPPVFSDHAPCVLDLPFSLPTAG